jgi:hypothetical protein
MLPHEISRVESAGRSAGRAGGWLLTCLWHFFSSSVYGSSFTLT